MASEEDQQHVPLILEQCSSDYRYFGDAVYPNQSYGLMVAVRSDNHWQIAPAQNASNIIKSSAENPVVRAAGEMARLQSP